ncbi:hypothetical protein ACC678_37585, partial [Rhizobium ruizarguesonis]
KLRENAIMSAGVLENIFRNRQKIDRPAVQDFADDTGQTIEKPHNTLLGPTASNKNAYTHRMNLR